MPTYLGFSYSTLENDFCFQRKARSHTSTEYAKLDAVELPHLDPFGGRNVDRKQIAPKQNLWVSEAAHLSLCLLKPEPHVHCAVHRHSAREVFSGFVTLAHALIQPTEAEVAMGDERTHPKLVGEGPCLSVEGLSFFGIRRIAMRSDLAESPESPRLVRP